MQVPKCTSWLGHRYEARYSKTPSTGWPKFNAEGKGMAELILDATRTVTYERDICIRCGHTIEKQGANT